MIGQGYLYCGPGCEQQVELCGHLQSQLSSLREEHHGVLNQLKEAHTLLERHVENTARANDKEVSNKLLGLYGAIHSTVCCRKSQRKDSMI